MMRKRFESGRSDREPSSTISSMKILLNTATPRYEQRPS
jgi:hypothetical protein